VKSSDAQETIILAHTETEFAVRGVKLRMFRGGEGDPVLFLHGAAGLSAWTPFFEAISQEHDLIVPEHPGWGKSDDPKWLHAIPDLAMFYLDFIDEIGLKKFHLIGNSLGGWLASEIAMRDSSRLKSLTLIAPAGLRPEGIPSENMFTWTPEQQVRNLFVNQAIADRMLSQPLTDEQKQMQLKNQAATAKYGKPTNFCNPALEKSLHRIAVPSLVVWGDADKVVPAAYAEHWKKHLPNAQVSIIPECGHLPHAEKAPVVAEQVAKFLRTAR
jgi:pimeloyl-ACP methyl ester carboxylesterase